MLVMLGACSGTPEGGAIFWIKGDAEFDQVELYFGTAPTTGAFATPSYGPQSGLVLERDFSTSDIVDLDGSRTEYKYLVPYAEQQPLGAYVGVVARKKSDSGALVDVALGEVFDFKAPIDRVYEYEVPLQTLPQLYQIWPDQQPSCFFWKRARAGQPERVAVVQAGNHDCDGLLASADCDDACSSRDACSLDQGCADAGVCATGCSLDGMCHPQTCLPTPSCSAICRSQVGLRAQVECAYSQLQLAEINLTTTAAGPCTNTIKLGFTCLNPQLMLQSPPDGWTFTPENDATTGCTLTFSPGATTANYRLLISFQPNASSWIRYTAAVAVYPTPSATNDCGSTGGYTGGGITYVPVYDCNPQ